MAKTIARCDSTATAVAPDAVAPSSVLIASSPLPARTSAPARLSRASAARLASPARSAASTAARRWTSASGMRWRERAATPRARRAVDSASGSPASTARSASFDSETLRLVRVLRGQPQRQAREFGGGTGGHWLPRVTGIPLCEMIDGSRISREPSRLPFVTFTTGGSLWPMAICPRATLGSAGSLSADETFWSTRATL